MLKTGLCSITFRQLNLQQTVDLVKQAGLDAIEWGGDIHVPPGDTTSARTARQLTLDAGLEISSYGSYYRVLDPDGNPEPFAPVLESALALGTDTIRVWAGSKGSNSADEEYRNRLVEESRRIAGQAEAHKIQVAFEFHNYTLTDSNESAARLLREINHSNVYTYWQPMYWGPDMDCRVRGLEQLKDKVLNLHVFHWHYDSSKEQLSDAIDRRPLEEGTADWKSYLSIPLPEKERFALIEFVRNDDQNQFLQDAAVLKQWAANML